MGTTNFGNQKLSVDYNQDARGVLFNNIGFEITPIGIYSGYTLTKASNSLVIVSSGVCFIQDSTNDVGLRVETEESQNISVSNATPYIVFRMLWVDAPNCFMDMLAVSYADIEADDIIVGRCIYDSSGTNMLTYFDYTRRKEFYTKKIKEQSEYIKVFPTEPISTQVIVSSGVLNSSKGNLIIAGGTFPTGGVSNTINGRIDLIYIDEDGAIQVEEGIDSPAPVANRYGNRKVIAEIRRAALRDSVRGNEIFLVSTSYDVPTITADLLIEDDADLYSSTNVEDALQEIAGQDFDFVGVKSIQGSVSVVATTGNVALKAQGIAGQNIQETKKADGTTVQYVDQNGKLVNTVRNELAILDVHSVFTTDRVEDALNQIAGGTMTIKGSKTFESLPSVPLTPTDNAHTASKKYVDDKTAAAFINNLAHPIGEIYWQLPGKSSPNTLYPGQTWNNISSEFEGLFFRAEGGNAGVFGTAQGDAIRNITGDMPVSPASTVFSSGALFTRGLAGKITEGGIAALSIGFDASRVVPTAVENRPVNTAIRIWERVS